MSTRLLLEGDNLESLLSRVRDEYGPSAQIVSAERMRTGGVAGFFAKERYELTVELAELTGRPRPIWHERTDPGSFRLSRGSRPAPIIAARLGWE